jgi:hypothetical protein
MNPRVELRKRKTFIVCGCGSYSEPADPVFYKEKYLTVENNANKSNNASLFLDLPEGGP